MTLIMRLVRSEMLEVLRTDYIKFARARGLTDRAVYFGHALKNTLVPVITIAGLQLGAIIAFAIITETVFQWPGMGLLFLKAVQNADIPIMAAYLLLVAAHLRGDQSHRRPALRRGRSAHPDRRPDAGHDVTEVSERPIELVRCRAGSRLPPLLDSDILHSFLRSKVTVVAAAGRARDRAGGGSRAPVIAPHDPFDLRQLSLLDSHNPPAWAAGGDRRFLLGTDDQGRDVLSTILYGSRISITIGVLSVLFAAALGISLGLVAGYAGGIADTLIMRIADVQLTFPAILIALADRRHGPRAVRRAAQPGASCSGSWCCRSGCRSGCSMPAPCAARRWSRRTRTTCWRRG